MTIEQLKAAIKAKEESLEGKRKKALELVNADNLEEAKNITAEIEADVAELAELKADLKEMEEEAPAEPPVVIDPSSTDLPKESKESRAFNEFLETRQITDGIKLDSKFVVVPKETSKEIIELADDVFKLKGLVTVKPVKNASGTTNVRTTQKATLKTVEELEASPGLGVTPFEEVDYKIKTKRGYIPASQESIDDGVNTIADLKSYMGEVVVNTDNQDIMNILDGLPEETAQGVDGLKTIVNTQIPVGTSVMWIMGQTIYNEIDLLKDENGRYLLEDSITAPSGKRLLGRDIILLNDEELTDKETFFVGDYKGIIYHDRNQLNAQWINYLHYGECLSIGVRNDIKLSKGAKIKKIKFEGTP